VPFTLYIDQLVVEEPLKKTNFNSSAGNQPKIPIMQTVVTHEALTQTEN